MPSYFLQKGTFCRQMMIQLICIVCHEKARKV